MEVIWTDTNKFIGQLLNKKGRYYLLNLENEQKVNMRDILPYLVDDDVHEFTITVSAKKVS